MEQEKPPETKDPRVIGLGSGKPERRIQLPPATTLLFKAEVPGKEVLDFIKKLSYIIDMRVEVLRQSMERSGKDTRYKSMIEGTSIRELHQVKRLCKMVRKGKEVMARPVLEARL